MKSDSECIGFIVDMINQNRSNDDFSFSDSQIEYMFPLDSGIVVDLTNESLWKNNFGTDEFLILTDTEELDNEWFISESYTELEEGYFQGCGYKNFSFDNDRFEVALQVVIAEKDGQLFMSNNIGD